MGWTIKYILKKLLGHEKFRSIVSWAANFFFKKMQNPPLPSPPALTYLMYAPLFGKRRLKTSGIDTYLSRWVCLHQEVKNNIINSIVL